MHGMEEIRVCTIYILYYVIIACKDILQYSYHKDSQLLTYDQHNNYYGKDTCTCK